MAVPSFIGALGQGDQVFSCVPGYDIWVTSGGNYSLTLWFYAGTCPQSGSIQPLQSVLPSSRTIASQITTLGGTASSSTSYQASSYSSGGAGGGSSGQVTGELTIKPFEFTTDQQVEIYQSLAVVFGAGLALMSLIWGLRRILRAFEGYSGASE